MVKPIKPGTDNQPAGVYKEVGPRGGKVEHPRIVTIDIGIPLRSVFFSRGMRS